MDRRELIGVGDSWDRRLCATLPSVIEDDDVALATVAVAAQGELGCPAAYGTATQQAETARIAVRRWRSVDRRHRAAVTRDQRIEDLAKGLRQHLAMDPKLEDLTHYRCIARAVADALAPDPSDSTGDTR